MTLHLEELSIAIKTLESAIRVVLLFAGGLWAYIKFLKGKVLHPKLELSVSGECVRENGCVYLAVYISVKNVSIQGFDLATRGNGLRVLSTDSRRPSDVIEALWTHLGTFSVLKSHEWIDGGEVITEQHLIVVPSLHHAFFRLELNVCLGDTVWNAVAISKLSVSNSGATEAKSSS